MIYIEVSGFLPMCGHGTIATCTVLAETGIIPVKEPVTEITLDTPAGLVGAKIHVEMVNCAGAIMPMDTKRLSVNKRLGS